MKNDFKYFICLLTVLVYFSGPTIAFGQVLWEFPLYFSDALGNKDTVTINIAEGATNATDSQYDEIELNDQLWNNTFEVRILIGDSPGGNGDLQFNPQYKNIFIDAFGFGTSSFTMPPCRMVIRAEHLPITMHYNQDQVGYPSFVNLIQDRTGEPRLIEDFTYQPYPEGSPGYPTFRCMMHRDSIVEDFSYFLARENKVAGTGEFGTTIHLENGDTIYTPGFEIYNFTSWAENYYCDRIVGTSNVFVESQSIFVQNPVTSQLTIKSKNNSLREWAIFDMSGDLVLQGDLFYTDQLDVSGLPSGLYIFNVRGVDEKVLVSKFVKL